MLASRERRRLDVPHEPGSWIEVRLLNWKKLEEAQIVRRQVLFATLREAGISLADLQRANEGRQEQDAGYDSGVLLRSAIVAWSYDAPVTPETIEDLDALTAEWLIGNLLAMHQRNEATRKN